ncbi:hypothetical protein [Lentilactobacillus diolivorans]|uniref:Uncharacterized protein n=2 Tax=Lentilactobacillus diolivorans TaxID=179838 RepID=A0A0R1SC50_9LACO|nr:hypothetical protein [Lentilactobacillus diolivorans]KRL64114.1 hypothetical protein FC85_GL001383 [Lentilactobacillus diolivorans DSM 14421]GEP23599.1 hypothetical protein LDI01_11920 [Lentilactobacillus diolivorans]
MLFFTQVNTNVEASWRHFNEGVLGYASRRKVLKYSPSGWGNFEAGYKNDYFKSNRYTQYVYSKKSRTMIIRYKNRDKTLNVKYNFRKIILRHGHKTPTFTYYYKVGKDRWTYCYTIKYWLDKPTRF